MTHNFFHFEYTFPYCSLIDIVVHVLMKKIPKTPINGYVFEIERISNNDNSDVIVAITTVLECVTNLVRGTSQVGYLTRVITASPVNDFDHLISLLRFYRNNDNLSCC